jgi:hypothetical protein
MIAPTASEFSRGRFQREAGLGVPTVAQAAPNIGSAPSPEEALSGLANRTNDSGRTPNLS